MSEEKKYTDMQEAFLEALCGEARGNIREAMNMAGYSPNTRINEVVGPLRDEIVDRASMVLAMNAPKATLLAILYLLSSSNISESSNNSIASIFNSSEFFEL